MRNIRVSEVGRVSEQMFSTARRSAEGVPLSGNAACSSTPPPDLRPTCPPPAKNAQFLACPVLA